jgi:hypothetical protein
MMGGKVVKTLAHMSRCSFGSSVIPPAVTRKYCNPTEMGNFVRFVEVDHWLR